jgi:hypothetical protein
MPVTYIRSETVVSRTIADETIVVPVRGGVGDLDSVYTFNGSGNTIWRLLEQPRSADEIAQLLQKDFSCEEFPQVLADVNKFLQELLSERLIEAKP